MLRICLNVQSGYSAKRQVFSVITPNFDPRKCLDSLQAGPNRLLVQLPRLDLVNSSQRAPGVAANVGFPILLPGHLDDVVSHLLLLYSAADAMVVHARQEAFGQTALDSHVCGTPVVAFNAAGLRDIVEHHKTGYLGKTFDTKDLATGLKWTLRSQMLNNSLDHIAREHAVTSCSYAVVSQRYMDAYELASSKF